MNEFPAGTEVVVNAFLVWIGYGTVVGLIAKAVMPGRDPGGPIVTLAMGITGVIIGCGVTTLFSGGLRVTPISPAGLVCGTLGAFVILLFSRILTGYRYGEAARRAAPTIRRPHRRRGVRSMDF